MLAFAAAEKLQLAPVGGGTRATLGNPTRPLDLLVSTSRLDRITEYAPDDFVVTAQAGVRLARLQAALAPQRQWLPLDPPAADPSTLGGILSADASGPHRFLHGTARDLVIGVEVALPDGTVVRSGGRVVKNVAGYDFKKLFIGAIGTLGVITSVSLKLQALPEHETLIAAGFPDFKSAAAAASALVRAGYELSALDLANRPAFRAAGVEGLPEDSACALLAALAGTEAANDAQAGEVAVLCARGGGLGTRAFAREACAETWTRLGTLLAPPVEDGLFGTTLRIAVPLGDVPAMAGQTEERLAAGDGARIIGRAGNGVLYVQPSPAPEKEMIPALRALRAEAVRLGGSLVIERGAASLRAALDAWGTAPPASSLFTQIKRAFDPAGTLSPGRFVGGL